MRLLIPNTFPNTPGHFFIISLIFNYIHIGGGNILKRGSGWPGIEFLKVGTYGIVASNTSVTF